MTEQTHGFVLTEDEVDVLIAAISIALGHKDLGLVENMGEEEESILEDLGNKMLDSTGNVLTIDDVRAKVVQWHGDEG